MCVCVLHCWCLQPTVCSFFLMGLCALLTKMHNRSKPTTMVCSVINGKIARQTKLTIVCCWQTKTFVHKYDFILQLLQIVTFAAKRHERQTLIECIKFHSIYLRYRVAFHSIVVQHVKLTTSQSYAWGISQFYFILVENTIFFLSRAQIDSFDACTCTQYTAHNGDRFWKLIALKMQCRIAPSALNC